MREKAIFLLPGPTSVPPRVLRALSAPIIAHRGPVFEKLLIDTTEGVKKIFQTNNDLITFTASGTGGMEAAVVNFLSPGEKAVVISIGSFGERFVKICENYNIETIVLEYPWGTPAVPEDLAAILAQDTGKTIKAVLVQHNETSTGVLNDIQAIAKAKDKHPALLIVDSVSGIAADDLQTDNWNIDVVIAGAQKAFMIPPGLAMLSVSEKAWDVARKTCNSNFYFNLLEAKSFLAKGQTPYTPAVSLLFGLEEALKIMLDEGLDNLWAKHRLHRDMVRAGVRALNLELLTEDYCASPAVTAIRCPEGVDSQIIVNKMYEEHNVVITAGQGKLTKTIFRIGHLGYVQPGEIIAALAALEMVLRDLGYPTPTGIGVIAAQNILQGSR